MSKCIVAGWTDCNKATMKWTTADSKAQLSFRNLGINGTLDTEKW